MNARLMVAGIAAALMSCAHHPGASTTHREFFAQAQGDNPWNRKIRNWQDRHQSDTADRRGRPRADSAELAEAYEEFTQRTRRKVVSDAVRWVQDQSRRYYRSDGDYDHWATLGEVIESGGDDCDGLDLLTFVLLRKLGFQEHEIYRAIVVERTSGQHHMVTLWFQDRESADPLVLDPTGVVSRDVVALSSVPQWDPIELFDESAHFAVQLRAVSEDVASD
jgi:hypothetical protein